MAIPITPLRAKVPSRAWSWREWLGNLTIFQALGSAIFAFAVFFAYSGSVVATGFAFSDQTGELTFVGSIGMLVISAAAIAMIWRRTFPNIILWVQCIVAIIFAGMPFLAWAAMPAALRTASRVPYPAVHKAVAIGAGISTTALCFYLEMRRSVELRALSTVAQDGSVEYLRWQGYVLVGVIGVVAAVVRSASSETALLEKLAQAIRAKTGRQPFTFKQMGVFASVPSSGPIQGTGAQAKSAGTLPQPFLTYTPTVPQPYVTPTLPEPQATAPKWAHFGPPQFEDQLPNQSQSPTIPPMSKDELERGAASVEAEHEKNTSVTQVHEAVDPQSARELERERIAMELHDTVAHQLSLAALQASALEVASETMDVPQSAQAVRGSINKALDEMRTLIWALRDSTAGGYTGVPPTLEDLERLISEASASGAPINSEIRIEQGETAQLSLTNAMYRITQEALTNAIRYGVKSSIFIRILGAPGLGITIDVMNQIADSSEIDAHGSLNGLGGMQARAEALGGSIETKTLGNVWIFQAKLPWS